MFSSPDLAAFRRVTSIISWVMSIPIALRVFHRLGERLGHVASRFTTFEAASCPRLR
jgi:hypothetical protein